MESKKYLEIIEIDIDKDKVEMIQLEVKDKKEAEDQLIFKEQERIISFPKYLARYHICNHNKNGKNRSCKIEILKEVK